MAKALHAVVDGRVQGVGFRGFVNHQAQQLSLRGWVRNLYDGRVEIMAIGNQDSLNQLLQLIHQGPPAAQVTSVETRIVESAQGVGGFSVLADSEGSW